MGAAVGRLREGEPRGFDDESLDRFFRLSPLGRKVVLYYPGFRNALLETGACFVVRCCYGNPSRNLMGYCNHLSEIEGAAADRGVKLDRDRLVLS